MKKLYNSKEKRTVLRLLLWFLLIAGNVHFYYAQNVAWAIESASRIETMIFVAFLDVSLFLSLLIWQGYDGFDSDVSIRYLFSFGLAILSYVVFYPAFYNSVHTVAEIKGVYTLSGHPVVLTGYAVLASIAAFWTFTGMFPTENKYFIRFIFNPLPKLVRFVSEIMTGKMVYSRIILRKTDSEKNKILDINQERENIGSIDIIQERERSFSK